MQLRRWMVVASLAGLAAGALQLAELRLRGDVLPEYKFQYNILAVANTAPGERPQVTFSVTDATTGMAYDLFAPAPGPFASTANGASRLFVQIGWPAREYANTGSGSNLAAVGPTPASPVAINALSKTLVTANPDGTYTVTSPKPIPASVAGSGAVAIEGHPALDVNGDGVLDRLPVKSAIRYFAITDSSPIARRQPVTVTKCNGCHQPHLSLHGNNRTDEPRVCVMCHNPDNTDIAYRTSGAEVPIDFKYMVHAIHAGDMRRNKYVVIGFNGSVNDFSGVRFPRSLADCLSCHIDGRYSLPLDSAVRGATVATGSTVSPKVVDANAADNLRITPIATVCSACHDDGETHRHMVRMGAAFDVTQAAIDSGRVRERCATCHGPGKDKDVRKVHAEEAAEEEHEGQF